MESAEREQLEELLSAYLDGELDAEDAALVEGLLHEEESARQLLEELRQTANVVSTLPRHAAPPSILEDLRSHIERGELLGDFEDARALSRGWRTPVVAMLSMAAMLALVSVSVWYYRDRPGVDSGPGDDVLTMASPDREVSEVRERFAKNETVGKRSRGAPRRSGRGDAVSKTRRDKKRGSAGGKGPRGPTDEDKVGKIVPPRESLPHRPAIALSQRAEVNLLATANIDQKLATSLRVAELRQHPFSNEAVRLQLATDDQAQRDAIAARLVSRLAERQIVDLADQGGSLPARAVASGGFYLRGRPGVNFEPAEEKQILIRVAAHDFNALLDEVDRLPIASDQVTLFSGPFGVRGLAYARRLLGEMAPGWTDQGPGERGGRLSSDEDGEPEGAIDTARGSRDRVAQGTGTLSDLIDNLSPDLGETFAAKPKGVSSPGTDKEEVAAEPAATSRPRQPPPPTVAAGEEPPEGVGGREDLAEAVATAAREPTKVKADDAAVSKRRRGKKGPAAVAEPSSLVDRRLKELGEPRQIADAGLVPSIESKEELWSYHTRESLGKGRPESALDVPPTTAYLTVVVRLVIEKPELEKPPAKGAGAESPARTDRKPPAQPPPTSVPQQ